LWHEAAGVYHVPIRHHSPACAAHLLALLDEVQPAQVLVEGPVDYQPLLALIADPATRPPVAVVAFPPKDADGHRVSYYPLCAHSPETVALQWARGRAELRFIDLPSDHRMMWADGDRDSDRDLGAEDAEPALNLAGESYFDANAYSEALCRRTGCRDQNELWDHLFETRLNDRDWRGFFRDVGVYCGHIRQTCSEISLERDGTLAREAQMAAMLRAARKEAGPIVVVTGGMHTVTLAAGTAKPAARPLRRSQSRSYLIRYGFRQLDRLSGYAAGMPMPGYYDQMWRVSREAGDDAGLTLLSGFATWLAERDPDIKPPFPAFVNAWEACRRLALLRGHATTTREDLLDACRSSFAKGEQDLDGAPVLARLGDYLSGAAIGDIPPSAGSPPLLEAVRSQAGRVGLRGGDGESRRRNLDIYRQPRHREASRFLHALTLLDTRFAERQSVPDFSIALDRDRLLEH